MLSYVSESFLFRLQPLVFKRFAIPCMLNELL